jgi:antitoxin component of RelBE/YafQ-DinJ toxin-antitoxin module
VYATGDCVYNVRMAKKRVDYRLSEEAVAALERIAEHYGLTATAVIELVLREADRRLPVVGIVEQAVTVPSPVQARAVERRFCDHGGMFVNGVSLCKKRCKK